VGDFKTVDVGVQLARRDEAEEWICRSKRYFDEGRMTVGCLASVGTAACIAGAIPTAGASVAVCTAVIGYTATTGLADCVSGIGDMIAEALGKEREYNDAELLAAAGTTDLTGLISSGIDVACQDVDNSHANGN
jgi:hypothetical protein